MDTNIYAIKDYSLLGFVTPLVPLLFEGITDVQNMDFHSNPTCMKSIPLTTQWGQEVREDKNREEGV